MVCDRELTKGERVQWKRFSLFLNLAIQRSLSESLSITSSRPSRTYSNRQGRWDRNSNLSSSGSGRSSSTRWGSHLVPQSHERRSIRTATASPATAPATAPVIAEVEVSITGFNHYRGQ